MPTNFYISVFLWSRRFRLPPARRKPRSAWLLLILTALLQAAPQDWLNSVAPVITPAEKKTYLSLPPADRASFEEKFWSTKSIDAEEYYRRLEFIDTHFGSSKRASGANTDQGRVYLSLGAPTKISRIPSSRIFVPLEIWYYDVVPGYLNTELRLLFYQPNTVGLPKLYSPTVDTIRALLLPESSAVHMFGPNDSVTESDIRQNLQVGPAEDEVITAATGVASGIKYSANQEILGQISSPEFMLSKARSTQVTSRLITARPELAVLRSPSVHGASQMDLRLMTSAQQEIGLEVLQGFAAIYNNRLSLKFSKAQQIEYTHRLDLLPGSYRLMFTVDSKTFAYPLEIPTSQTMGEIERADLGLDVSKRDTPFEFDGKQISLDPTGGTLLVSVPQPSQVTWLIREGARIVSRSVTEAGTIAMLPLPDLRPGTYKVEAIAVNASQKTDLVIAPAPTKAPENILVSFNANLAPARRLAFIGNQWLLRGRFDLARATLNESLAKSVVARGEVKDAQIALARVDAMSADLDAARDRVRQILAAYPNDFEALSAYAYIETKFQDYPVAAQFYRRALAVQDSPALRMALAKLPTQ